MPEPKFLPDDYGYYRCRICGHLFNRDEVSESREVISGNGGKIITIFYHTCDDCLAVLEANPETKGELK